MSTYKNTNNCLLFFSAKFFLEAVNTLFQFRFVATKEKKWVLEFRPVNELIWQRKAISICLTSNKIEFKPDQSSYYITTCENNVEEDVHIIKVYYVLHQLLVDALNKPELLLPQHFVSVSDLKLFTPYHFDHTKFSSWKRIPGLATLRISNAGINDNYANIYLAFNNWKYIRLAKRETSNKKRKLELEEKNEIVSNELIQPMSLNPVPMQECEPVEIKN